MVEVVRVYQRVRGRSPDARHGIVQHQQYVLVHTTLGSSKQRSRGEVVRKGSGKREREENRRRELMGELSMLMICKWFQYYVTSSYFRPYRKTKEHRGNIQ